MNFISNEDMEYLAQQSTGRMNMIISGMTALMNDTDEKISIMESQGWCQRMLKTVTGRNKITKQEIQQNHDKLNAYMSEALAELYRRGCIEQNILISLGTQINEVYADHLQLKQMLGAFVTKLNEKMESIDNFHMLNEEITLGLYNQNTPLRTICKILSQFNDRMLDDSRKQEIIKRNLQLNKIITDEPVLITDWLEQATETGADEIGAVYLELNTLQNNFFARVIARLFEKYFFISDMERMMINKEGVISAIISDNNLNKNVALSSESIYESLVQSKLENKDVILLSSVNTSDYTNRLEDTTESNYSEAESHAEELFLNNQYEEAFPIFLKETENENSRAMSFVGRCYKNGMGTQFNEYKAKEWYQKSKDADDILGTYIYATTYEKNKYEQSKLLRRVMPELINLADQGDTTAIILLGIEYSTKQSDFFNMSKAVECLEKVKNFSWAKVVLGCCFWDETWSEHDYKKTFQLFSEAEEEGNVLGLYKIAQWYDFGDDTSQNKETAFHLYRKAAERGYPDAIYNLANCYRYGNGTYADEKEAFRLYKQLADGGDVDGIYEIAECYDSGFGIEKNEKEAFRLYKKSADMGKVEAYANIAVYYHDGTGVEKSGALAIQYGLKGAQLGNAISMFVLGLIYQMDEDYNQAFIWFQKGAQAGNEACMYELGMSYLNGKGVEHDWNEGKKWIEKAAELGNDDAKKVIADGVV